ncbi:GlxA family transcriptional regulator [Kibdelosporangium persicum]|uniref:HTH-type transcriptional regulator CdhR n=1 Tax=Kibdelosporangium persicum TaxID=2698649 RepID=A0ABX2EVK4_9PSEU|nr:helix-turn-helix domain-containing protein [Kibdelosporangium persicum]NRN63068.1 HTH-type transcriptional regulator CdhR [Kibdelosporangium persicum]
MTTVLGAVRSLVVVVFDGVSLGIMSFAFGVFDMAASFGELRDVDVRLVSGEPDAALSGGGLSCPVPYDLAAIRDADLVIVPNWRSPFENPPEPALAAIRAAHARGARVAGLCSGAFVLAAAGLLDGRPATTHWGMAGLLADLHPKVKVDAGALYVDDGDVLTAGGGASGMDLGLHLIRAMCGADVATRLAKGMVLPPHRQGGQAQYIESPVPNLDDQDPIAETMAWALTKLDTTLPVDDLAQRAHMSRRNYDRRFREITGTAPATWLTHQRVIRAQRLLESTALPVDLIARYCGFSSAAALRPHFRRLVGVAPAAYRETFGSVS